MALRTNRFRAYVKMKRQQVTLKRRRERLYFVFRRTSKEATDNMDMSKATGSAPADIPSRELSLCIITSISKRMRLRVILKKSMRALAKKILRAMPRKSMRTMPKKSLRGIQGTI